MAGNRFNEIEELLCSVGFNKDFNEISSLAGI